jgi:hypothetical protein
LSGFEHWLTFLSTLKPTLSRHRQVSLGAVRNRSRRTLDNQSRRFQILSTHSEFLTWSARPTALGVAKLVISTRQNSRRSRLSPGCAAASAELNLGMARYLARRCPRCQSDWGVFIAESKRGRTFRPIHALCAGCGYEIAWTLIVPAVRAQIPWKGNLN